MIIYPTKPLKTMSQRFQREISAIRADRDLRIEWLNASPAPDFTHASGTYSRVRQLHDELAACGFDTTIICHVYHDFGDADQPDLYFTPKDPQWRDMIARAAAN